MVPNNNHSSTLGGDRVVKSYLGLHVRKVALIVAKVTVNSGYLHWTPSEHG